ncbi:DNA-directed RNA polymerase subunit H [Candidatus Woesearchaeota archaeon]|nr:DNA-directed RNA polymerase subunit H [Candidatus Woesearchaeota archaeon]
MAIEKEMNIDVEKHVLVPKHSLLSDKDKVALFEKYNILEFNLPKILITDVAIKKLDPKIGDIIKIERVSLTAGKSLYYRVVI